MNKKYPTPDINQGWDTYYIMYSTVPPWLQTSLPLVDDTVTGAPGRPFPTVSSEVVSNQAGVRSHCTKLTPLCRILPSLRVFITAFNKENIAYDFTAVNPCERGEKSKKMKKSVYNNHKTVVIVQWLHNFFENVSICNYFHKISWF